MRIKFVAVLVLGLSLAASVASAAFSNVQDFDSESKATSDTLATKWGPQQSGSTVGVVALSSLAVYSNEQAHAGNLSGKLQWQWDATTTTKLVRIQPTAAGWIAGSSTTVDRTSTPFVGCYVYGYAHNDIFSIYMGEGATGGGSGPYEEFTRTPLTWNGWKLYERNLLTAPVTAFATGDGTLNASNTISGVFFRPPAADLYNGDVVDYYVDDFGYSDTSRADAGVGNWSVY